MDAVNGHAPEDLYADEWSPADFVALREDTSHPGLTLLRLWPDRPRVLFDFRALGMLLLDDENERVVARNPFLQAALEAGGYMPQLQTPKEQPDARMKEMEGWYDANIGLMVKKPRWYFLDELDAKGRPPGPGLCIHDLGWTLRLRLIDISRGETGALRTFRAYLEGEAALRDGGDVRPEAEQLPGPSGADPAGAADRVLVRRGDLGAGEGERVPADESGGPAPRRADRRAGQPPGRVSRRAS